MPYEELTLGFVFQACCSTSVLEGVDVSLLDAVCCSKKHDPKSSPFLLQNYDVVQ